MSSALAFQLAGDAIEEYVAEHHSADSGVWQNIVPETDWDYEDRDWQAAASDIVNRFNQRLPAGQDIEVPTSAKRASRSKRLIEFQVYLAAKATSLGVSGEISAMEE
ncbi:MAG: hypothetical protein QOJ94_209 [Sphingomonadales bacterium]|jgi:hypothetical protein|nr:hypothetical protein [Sphingomonadales bacterium]